jgi:hypothetical protein
MYQDIILFRSKGFIFCISGNGSERGKSSEYYCSVLLDGSREISTFKETSNLHHNEAEGAFTLGTVTSEYL